MATTVKQVFVNDYRRGYKTEKFSIAPTDWIAEGTYFRYTKFHDLGSKDFVVNFYVEGSGGEEALAGMTRLADKVTIYWNNNTDTIRVQLVRGDEET